MTKARAAKTVAIAAAAAMLLSLAACAAEETPNGAAATTERASGKTDTAADKTSAAANESEPPVGVAEEEFAKPLFRQGLLAVKSGEKWGYIDKSGNFSIEPKFDEAENFSQNGLAYVKLNGSYGYIDKSGSFVIDPPQVNETFGLTENGSDNENDPQLGGALDFAENGLAVMQSGVQYGYIDQSGSFVIEPQFKDARKFSAIGLARAYRKGKYGYIDRTGNFVIEPIFDEGSDFYDDGFAVVKTNGSYGIIDFRGNYIASPQFSDCSVQTDSDVIKNAIISADSIAQNIGREVDSLLTDMDTMGSGLKRDAGVTISINISDGNWTSVPTEYAPSSFNAYGNITTWNGGHSFDSSSEWLECTDGVDFLSIRLANFFPDIRDGAISMRLFGGRCIAVAYSAETQNADDIPVADVYGEDPAFNTLTDKAAPWNGTIMGISDSDRMPGVADDLIIGTSPKLGLDEN